VLSFSSGRPIVLFEGTYSSHSALPECPLWDIHSHGKKFLILKPSAATTEESTQETARKISVVLNWFEELMNPVPVD